MHLLFFLRLCSVILGDYAIMLQLSCGFSNDPLILLNMLLISHPFKDMKAILWTFIIKAFLALMWNEQNHRFFENKEMDFTYFFDHLLYTSLT